MTPMRLAAGGRSRALLALVLGGLLAGCGANPGAPAGASSPRALAAVAGAVGLTVAAPAALHVSEVVHTGQTTMRGSGLFEVSRGQGSLTLTTRRGASWSLIYLPRTVYSHPPRESGWELRGARLWMSIDLTTASTLSANLPAFVAQLEYLNPLVTLDELRWGAVAARSAGTGLTNGVRSSRYDVTVDLLSAVNKANGLDKVAFEAATTGIDRSIMPRVRVWVGERGQLVQLQAAPLVGSGSTVMRLQSSRAHLSLRPPASGQSTDVRAIGPAAERENLGGGDSDGA